MTIEKLRPNYTFTEDKLSQLKEVLPEAFADGKINFETIKEILAEYLEEENQEKEHFGLFWVGKRQARKIASIPSKGTLVPVKGEGIDEDTTKNIFIEGDNLEVLKLLQKSYANRIKMIYIDPPYNTGNDFVYEDDFSEPIKEYLRRTGQVDEQGRELTTNKKSDGRYHAKWLSMMYPRLTLARNLLREDGVIFISIDDNEVANLKLLCNEIFGEENFVDCVIWQKKYSPQNDAKWFSAMHDFILIYAKGKDIWFPNLLPRTEEMNDRYKNPDNDHRGNWKSGDFSVKTYLKSNDYEIITPSGRVVNPPSGRCWRSSKEKFEEMVKDNRIWFGEDGNNVPSIKRFLSEVRDGMTPTTIWYRTEVGDNQEGAKEIRELFEIPPFDTPKPTRLLKRILHLSSNEDDIILDFFAGSSTTAHSTFLQNQDDKSKRRFIMIQIPERINENSIESNYKNISDVSKERIRRSINKIKSENESKLDFNENNQDLGFKVFKLTESNYKEWKDFDGNDTQQLELAFDTFVSPLRENWKKEDLISEIMIIEGFSLDSKIRVLETFNKNEVIEITSEFCSHKLLISLDQKLEKNTIDSLILDANDIFICLDTAIDDNHKIKLSDKGLIKTI